MMIVLYLFFETSVLVPCLVQDTTSHKTPISMLSMVKDERRTHKRNTQHKDEPRGKTVLDSCCRSAATPGSVLCV